MICGHCPKPATWLHLSATWEVLYNFPLGKGQKILVNSNITLHVSENTVPTLDLNSLKKSGFLLDFSKHSTINEGWVSQIDSFLFLQGIYYDQ